MATVQGTSVPPTQGSVVQGTVLPQQRQVDVPSYYAGLREPQAVGPPAQGTVVSGTVVGPAMTPPVVVQQQPSAESAEDGKPLTAVADTADIPTATPLDVGSVGMDGPTVIGQPVIAQPIGGGGMLERPPGTLGRWLSDPFEAWCSGADMCLTSTCCICFPLADAAADVGQDYNFIRCLSGAFWTIHLMTEGPLVFCYWPWCCFLKMCALTGNATLVTATRARTSARDHIPIDNCDAGFSFCCGPCAVAQMTTHNRRRFAQTVGARGPVALAQGARGPDGATY